MTSVPTNDLSLSQVSFLYGFNTRVLLGLIQEGVLVKKCGKITAESLATLVEGEHYLQCLECGAFAAMIHSSHLKVCSGLRSLDEYLVKHPGAPVQCRRNKVRKAKTQEQREAQSKKLKDRFQTPEGEVTRQRIAIAARQMQASESGQRSQALFRSQALDPNHRVKLSQQSKARWATPEGREKVVAWHRDNKNLSNTLVAKARQGNKKKRTKLHLQFKTLMENHGITGFLTEYEIGYYAIDEANPDLKLALEVDGCYWHSCPQCGLKGPTESLRTDKSKTTYLTNRGWSVLRIWEHDINQDPMGCLDRVRQFVKTRERENHVG